MPNLLDLRPYHVRHRYTPMLRFYASIGLLTMLAIVVTGILAMFQTL